MQSKLNIHLQDLTQRKIPLLNFMVQAMIEAQFILTLE